MFNLQAHSTRAGSHWHLAGAIRHPIRAVKEGFPYAAAFSTGCSVCTMAPGSGCGRACVRHMASENVFAYMPTV